VLANRFRKIKKMGDFACRYQTHPASVQPFGHQMGLPYGQGNAKPREQKSMTARPSQALNDRRKVGLCLFGSTKYGKGSASFLRDTGLELLFFSAVFKIGTQVHRVRSFSSFKDVFVKAD
jgi:hypothetical protein